MGRKKSNKNGASSEMDGCFDDSAGFRERIQALLKYPDLQSLCDVVFMVGTQKFPAHRAVLACASPVFRKMFTNGMKETNILHFPLEIQISDLDPRSWEIALRYMYTGKVVLEDEEMALLALASAHKYLLKDLCTFIETFLVSRCSVENCVDLYEAAELYDMKELKRTCFPFMEKHFEELPGSTKFLEKSGKDLLLRLLQSDRLIVKSEVTVFDSIIAWVQADKERRSPYLEELLNFVQLSKLTELEIATIGRKTLFSPHSSFRSCLLDRWILKRHAAHDQKILNHLIPRRRFSESMTLTHRLLFKENFKTEENTQWEMIPERNIMIRIKINPTVYENDRAPGCSCNGNYGCECSYSTDEYGEEVYHYKKHISLYLEVEPICPGSTFNAKMRLRFFVMNTKNPSATFSRYLDGSRGIERGPNGFPEFMLLDKLEDYLEENPRSVLLGVNVVLL